MLGIHFMYRLQPWTVTTPTGIFQRDGQHALRPMLESYVEAFFRAHLRKNHDLQIGPQTQLSRTCATGVINVSWIMQVAVPRRIHDGQQA